MKLNFNTQFNDLDGNVIEPNLGKLVANLLVSETKGDAIKMFDWAVKLNKGEELDLDRSDQDKLRTIVTETDKFTVLFKAPVLEILSKKE